MVLRSAPPLALLVVGALLGVPAPGTCDVPLDRLDLVPLNGVEAQLRASGAGVAVSFRKGDPGRRLLAVRARPSGVSAGVRSLALRWRLDASEGVAARPAALVTDADGERWVKIGNETAPSRELLETRLSLAAMRPADFSPRASGAIEWPAVREVWLGVLLDGTGSGTLHVESAALADSPQRPSAPISLTGPGAGNWTVHHDAALAPQRTTPDGGPGGKPCLRVEFAFPGGRHMFCNSSLPLPAVDLEGYRALRLTYRAALPPGIGGLLVLLSEDGGACYRADPMPPASAEWRVLELPLEKLKLAEWTKDADGRLDMGKVTHLWVGTHGAAAGEGGPGWVEVCGAELVP